MVGGGQLVGRVSVCGAWSSDGGYGFACGVGG